MGIWHRIAEFDRRFGVPALAVPPPEWIPGDGPVRPLRLTTREMREARLTALAVLLAGLTDLALVPAARRGLVFIAIGIAVLLSLVAIPRVRRLFRPSNISVRLLPDGVPLVARPARLRWQLPLIGLLYAGVLIASNNGALLIQLAVVLLYGLGRTDRRWSRVELANEGTLVRFAKTRVWRQSGSSGIYLRPVS